MAAAGGGLGSASSLAEAENKSSSANATANIEVSALSQRINSLKSTLTSSMLGQTTAASKSKTKEDANINNTNINQVFQDFNNVNLSWPDLLGKYAALSGQLLLLQNTLQKSYSLIETIPYPALLTDMPLATATTTTTASLNIEQQQEQQQKQAALQQQHMEYISALTHNRLRELSTNLLPTLLRTKNFVEVDNQVTELLTVKPLQEDDNKNTNTNKLKVKNKRKRHTKLKTDKHKQKRIDIDGGDHASDSSSKESNSDSHFYSDEDLSNKEEDISVGSDIEIDKKEKEKEKQTEIRTEKLKNLISQITDEHLIKYRNTIEERFVKPVENNKKAALRVHGQVYIYIYICVCVCMYVYIYVYLCVCMQSNTLPTELLNVFLSFPFMNYTIGAMRFISYLYSSIGKRKLTISYRNRALF